MPDGKSKAVPAGFYRLPYTGRLISRTEVRNEASWHDLVGRDKEEARIAARSLELKKQKITARQAEARRQAEENSPALREARLRQKIRFERMLGSVVPKSEGFRRANASKGSTQSAKAPQYKFIDTPKGPIPYDGTKKGHAEARTKYEKEEENERLARKVNDIFLATREGKHAAKMRELFWRERDPSRDYDLFGEDVTPDNSVEGIKRQSQKEQQAQVDFWKSFLGKGEEHGTRALTTLAEGRTVLGPINAYLQSQGKEKIEVSPAEIIGDTYSTLGDIYHDARILFHPDATIGERAGAAANIFVDAGTPGIGKAAGLAGGFVKRGVSKVGAAGTKAAKSFSSSAAGKVVASGVEELRQQFGKEAFAEALLWLKQKGVEPTKRAIEEALRRLTPPQNGLQYAMGGYGNTQRVIPSPKRQPSDSISWAEGKSSSNRKSQAVRKTRSANVGSTPKESLPSNPIEIPSTFNFVVQPGAVPYPAPIDGLPLDRVTKELMHFLLPKSESFETAAMGVDSAINNYINSATNVSRVRGQGGVLGEVQHTDDFLEERAGVIATAVDGDNSASSLYNRLVQADGRLAQFMLRQPTTDGSHGSLVAMGEFRDAMSRYKEDEVVDVINMGIQSFNRMKKYKKAPERFRLELIDSVDEMEYLYSTMHSFDRRKDLHRKIFSSGQDMFPTHDELRKKFVQPELADYDPGALAGFVTVDIGSGPISRDSLSPGLRHFRYKNSFLGRNHGRLNGQVDLVEAFPELVDKIVQRWKQRRGHAPSKKQLLSVMRFVLEWGSEVHNARREALIRASFDR